MVADMLRRAAWASRRFVPKTFRSLERNVYIWTIRSLDVSFPGRFVLKTIRTLDDSFSGRFVLWTFRSQDDSYHGRFVLWTFRSLDVSFFRRSV